jgi:hypothetical protein
MAGTRLYVVASFLFPLLFYIVVVCVGIGLGSDDLLRNRFHQQQQCLVQQFRSIRWSFDPTTTATTTATMTTTAMTAMTTALLERLKLVERMRSIRPIVVLVVRVDDGSHENGRLTVSWQWQETVQKLSRLYGDDVRVAAVHSSSNTPVGGNNNAETEMDWSQQQCHHHHPPTHERRMGESVASTVPPMHTTTLFTWDESTTTTTTIPLSQVCPPSAVTCWYIVICDFDHPNDAHWNDSSTNTDSFRRPTTPQWTIVSNTTALFHPKSHHRRDDDDDDDDDEIKVTEELVRWYPTKMMIPSASSSSSSSSVASATTTSNEKNTSAQQQQEQQQQRPLEDSVSNFYPHYYQPSQYHCSHPQHYPIQLRLVVDWSQVNHWRDYRDAIQEWMEDTDHGDGRRRRRRRHSTMDHRWSRLSHRLCSSGTPMMELDQVQLLRLPPPDDKYNNDNDSNVTLLRSIQSIRDVWLPSVLLSSSSSSSSTTPAAERMVVIYLHVPSHPMVLFDNENANANTINSTTVTSRHAVFGNEKDEEEEDPTTPKDVGARRQIYWSVLHQVSDIPSTLDFLLSRDRMQHCWGVVVVVVSDDDDDTPSTMEDHHYHDTSTPLATRESRPSPMIPDHHPNDTITWLFYERLYCLRTISSWYASLLQRTVDTMRSMVLPISPPSDPPTILLPQQQQPQQQHVSSVDRMVQLATTIMDTFPSSSSFLTLDPFVMVEELQHMERRLQQEIVLNRRITNGQVQPQQQQVDHHLYYDNDDSTTTDHRSHQHQRKLQQQQPPPMTDYPLEQYAAIFGPLVVPLLVPLCITWIREVLRYRHLRRQQQ